MSMPVQSLFAKISKNNLIVDQFIDNLIETACNRIDDYSDRHQQELEKTSKLLVLSGLIQGDKEF